MPEARLASVSLKGNVKCQIRDPVVEAVPSSESVAMAVWVWIGRLVLVLAVVVFVLLKLTYAMITGFFRLL